MTLIVDGIDMKLYLDDQLIGHNKNVKREIVELGKELKSYLGRSFYNGDTYFKGAFDNIKVYNRVLSDSELKGERQILSIMQVIFGHFLIHQTDMKRFFLDIARMD